MAPITTGRLSPPELCEPRPDPAPTTPQPPCSSWLPRGPQPFLPALTWSLVLFLHLLRQGCSCSLTARLRPRARTGLLPAPLNLALALLPCHCGPLPTSWAPLIPLGTVSLAHCVSLHPDTVTISRDLNIHMGNSNNPVTSEGLNNLTPGGLEVSIYSSRWQHINNGHVWKGFIYLQNYDTYS